MYALIFFKFLEKITNNFRYTFPVLYVILFLLVI